MNKAEAQQVRDLLTQAMQIIEGDSQATLPGGSGPAEVGEYSSIVLVPGTNIVAERFWVFGRLAYAVGAELDEKVRQQIVIPLSMMGDTYLENHVVTAKTLLGTAMATTSTPADLGWTDGCLTYDPDGPDRVQRWNAAGRPSICPKGKLSSSGEIMVGGGPTVGKPA